MRRIKLTKNGRFLLLLAIGGSILIGLGVFTIGKGESDYQDKISSSSLKPIPIDDPRPIYTIPNSYITDVTIEYQTDDILSVNNPFNYTVIAVVNDSKKFDKIEAYLYPIAYGMTIPKTEDVMFFKNNGVSIHNITLSRNPIYDSSFNGSEINLVMHTEENLGLFLIPYTNGAARGGVLAYQETPLIIHPAIEKLHANTDRYVQRQSIESDRTNAHVEGLTLIIIGLVPLGLVGEYFIEKRVECHFRDIDNPKIESEIEPKKPSRLRSIITKIKKFRIKIEYKHPKKEINQKTDDKKLQENL